MSSFSVFKQKNLSYIDAWKKHVSQKQLLKFIPDTKSENVIEISKLIEGQKCLFFLQRLTNYFLSKDNTNFLNTVELLATHLTKYPTLIPFFPQEFLKNLRELRKYAVKDEIKNVIYLTKHHMLTCAKCKEKIQGNLSKQTKCLCSFNFYHNDCYTQLGKKCNICNYIYE